LQVCSGRFVFLIASITISDFYSAAAIVNVELVASGLAPAPGEA